MEPRARASADRKVALIETEEPYSVVAECVPLVDAGYDVILCSGPRPDQTCAALDGQTCPLVDNAAIVINAVRDRATQNAMVRGMRQQSPTVPVAVIVSGGRAAHTPGTVRYPTVTALATQLRRSRRPDLVGAR